MLKPSVTIEETIALLNSALETDREAISSLIEHRVPCSDAMAEHPTIQVSPNQTVGLLGIINGLFGTDERATAARSA